MIKAPAQWWLSFVGMGIACGVVWEFILIFAWYVVAGSSGLANPPSLIPLHITALVLGCILSYKFWPPATPQEPGKQHRS